MKFARWQHPAMGGAASFAVDTICSIWLTHNDTPNSPLLSSRLLCCCSLPMGPQLLDYGFDNEVLLILTVLINKKLSCRTETAQRFVSLNILLSHSVTQGHSKWHCWAGRVQVSISISLTLCLCVEPFTRYSASKNGAALKVKVGVVHGHWKWRRR